MSKHMKIKLSSSIESNEDNNFDFYLPMFIYALRDFSLELEIDGKEVTSDEYLEYCLTLKRESSEKDKVNHFRFVMLNILNICSCNLKHLKVNILITLKVR